MGSRSYSFLDAAALPAVGPRLAAGDALVVLDTSLATVLWANGSGARLFGAADLLGFIGADPALRGPVRRQIEATSGFPRIGKDRNLLLRLAGGLFSRTTAFSASEIEMPDGEAAILLAASPAHKSGRDAEAAAIEGLSGEGQFAALVDGGGNIVAAPEGFSELGIGPATLANIAGEVRREADRLVKRPLQGAAATMPAGIALLRDEPALSLLIVVQDAGEEAAPETAETEASGIEAPSSPPAEAAATESDGNGPDEHGPASGEADDRWYFNGRADAGGEAPAGTASTGVEDGADLPAGPADVAPAEIPDDLPRQPQVELAAVPVRFVWRTDAEGRFSAISDEFRKAFGDAATDIVGKPFDDVSRAFDLDPDGEIAGLLARRDTWSGRAVLWPVAGTDLRVPVDLAALPVYGRERNFEGFRGFGVARMGDAVVDPQGTGLTLGVPHADDDDADASAPPASEDDPFRGEVPALSVAPAPVRRDSDGDKVIQLAERRAPTRDLSASERSNFREIGEKLRSAGAAEPEADGTEAEADESGPLSDPETPEAQTAAEFIEPPIGEEADAEPPAEAAPSDDTAGSEAPPAIDLGAFAASSYDAANAATDAADEPVDGIGTLSPADEFVAGIDDEAEPLGTTDFSVAAEAGEDLSTDTVQPGTGTLSPADEMIAATAGESMSGYEEPEQSAPASQEAPPDMHGEQAAPAEPAGFETQPEMPAETQSEIPAEADRVDPEVRGIETEVLSRLPLPIVIHRGDVLYYANREFLQVTGYGTLEELDAEGGLGALFGDPYGEGDERKLRLRRRDGAELPVDAFLQSVAWNGGKALLLSLRPAGEIAAATPADNAPADDAPDGNATDGREARLDELRTIIDTATDGVVLIENDGTIRSISRPAEALFGFEAEDVRGKPFSHLFAMESQRAARDYLASLAENGVASVLNDGREVIGREAQGRFIPLFMTIGRLPQDSGYCAVVRDITQFKRTEEELTQARAQAERASSQKTDFLARVSHEIRTPLNAIIGFSELMMDEKFGPITNERYKDYLRDINRSGNHVLDLVNDLLDISKIEAGQLELSYEAVSLNEILADAVAMMQPQANRERVIIRSSLPARLPDVVADMRSIRQIALNLLSNAIRYTPAGGQVIVSTSYESTGDILMRVRDTGIGMAAAEIEQALKPFKQINALKRPRGDGTGLGLPLTKAMVEANRARFAIQSTPGEGTLVEIAFPSTRVLAH